MECAWEKGLEAAELGKIVIARGWWFKERETHNMLCEQIIRPQDYVR